MPPENGSESFDGKEENLFDVDLIPMTGEESDDGYGPQRNRNPASYVPGSFDPADVQADLIPMYDTNGVDQDEYDQPKARPEGPPPQQESLDTPKIMGRRPPPVNFDVVVSHRVTDDGQVIFEPRIRTEKGGGRVPPKMEPNKVTILPIMTEAPIEGPIELTTQKPFTKIIIRRVIKRKPGDPGYGTGRVVKVIKRIKQ